MIQFLHVNLLPRGARTMGARDGRAATLSEVSVVMALASYRDRGNNVARAERAASLSLYTGRGRGEGTSEDQTREYAQNPLPNPLPVYRERELVRVHAGVF